MQNTVEMPATTTTSNARSKAKTQPQQQLGPNPSSQTSSSKGATSASTVVQPIGSQVVVPSSAGFLVTCDPATKQFIKFLEKSKSADKKFIIEDLDANHLLIDGRVKDEILRKVESWMDEVCVSISSSHHASV